ncbi:MAG TPA: right-handed parallel beta-helix repeat-containing protein [Xanthomonadaceae bacterium]|nr:right-handed parallel beta-helix repeat-containing protein [Xanthomonadaceae bacterium]
MPSTLVRAIVPVAAALCCAAASAATYYVDDGGSDGNLGTLSQPWATLQKAADTVQPGDTVLVRAGNYAGGHFTTGGTPSQRIVLAAFPGEAPVVNANNPVTSDGINLEGASYMTVEGFTVTGTGRAGIRAVLCDGVEIRDNLTDLNARWGIFTGFCDDLLIEGNQASRSGIEHGIYVSNSGDRPVIRGNLIFGNHANGIHMNGDASQGGDGIISQALVEDNVIYDNGTGGGSGINCDGVQDSLIRNNLVFDSHASGISLYRIDGGGPSTGNRVLNNTVRVASDGRWALNIQDASSGNVVRNNILYSEHSFRGAVDICADCLIGLDSDHNAVEDRYTTDGGDNVLSLAQWSALTGQDMNSVATTPAALFTDATGDDYTLSSTSPALDAGATRADVPRDLVGTARPQGAAFDIGAYETPDSGLIFRNGFEP